MAVSMRLTGCMMQKVRHATSAAMTAGMMPLGFFRPIGIGCGARLSSGLRWARYGLIWTMAACALLGARLMRRGCAAELQKEVNTCTCTWIRTSDIRATSHEKRVTQCYMHTNCNYQVLHRKPDSAAK
eukprot:scaffold10143_cov120-Isochrysis_galbana.AAC.8